VDPRSTDDSSGVIRGSGSHRDERRVSLDVPPMLGRASTMKKSLLAAAACLAAGFMVNPVQPAQAGGSMNINVASFNIQSVSLDRTSGEQRPWKDRRTRWSARSSRRTST